MENAKHPEPRIRETLRLKARQFAELRRGLKRRLGILAPLRIVFYGGYGHPRGALIRGRVLEEKQRRAPAATDRALDNFRRAFFLIESDEVPNVKLEVCAGGASASITTDEDGYFLTRLAFPAPVDPGWLRVELAVREAPYPVEEPPTTDGDVLIPAPTARFGVISDIDDTILRTHVTNRAKMVYLTLLWNAVTRRSFDGTTELYQGLLSGGRDAPFFYVSQSMWNIFPLLEHFIDHQKLPRGPILLRQVGLLARRTPEGHKAATIRDLLTTYRELPFILIGDSGQRDLEFYLAAARAHPGRISSILIRNVSNVARARALRELAERETPPGCSTLIFDETQEAIEHCQRLGFWAAPTLVAAPAENVSTPAGAR